MAARCRWPTTKMRSSPLAPGGTCYMEQDVDPFRDHRRSAPVLLQFCHRKRLKVHSGRMSKIQKTLADLRLCARDGMLVRVELTGFEPVTPTLPVGTKWRPDQRKHRIYRWRGTIQCSSARFGTVQTHGLLQFCSTLIGVKRQ